MKFLVKLAVILAIVIGILLWLQSASEESGRPKPMAAAPEPQPTAAAPVSPMTMVQPAAAPVALATSVPAPPRPASDPQASRITAAAQRAGLQVAGIAPQDGWLLVTVRGRDRNHVADFLDAARLAGMRDVDLNYNRYTQFVAQGRMVAQATYRIRF